MESSFARIRNILASEYFGGAMALGIVSRFCSSFERRGAGGGAARSTILTVGLRVFRAALLTLVVATVAWIFAVRHRADEYRRGRMVVGIVAAFLSKLLCSEFMDEGRYERWLAKIR